MAGGTPILANSTSYERLYRNGTEKNVTNAAHSIPADSKFNTTTPLVIRGVNPPTRGAKAIIMGEDPTFETPNQLREFLNKDPGRYRFDADPTGATGDFGADPGESALQGQDPNKFEFGTLSPGKNREGGGTPSFQSTDWVASAKDPQDSGCYEPGEGRHSNEPAESTPKKCNRNGGAITQLTERFRFKPTGGDSGHGSLAPPGPPAGGSYFGVPNRTIPYANGKPRPLLASDATSWFGPGCKQPLGQYVVKVENRPGMPDECKNLHTGLHQKGGNSKTGLINLYKIKINYDTGGDGKGPSGGNGVPSVGSNFGDYYEVEKP